jgi:hypothetical protein
MPRDNVFSERTSGTETNKITPFQNKRPCDGLTASSNLAGIRRVSIPELGGYSPKSFDGNCVFFLAFDVPPNRSSSVLVDDAATGKDSKVEEDV